MACAPDEDSDQPVHQCNIILLMRTAKTQTGRMYRRWSVSSKGVHVILKVLLCLCSYIMPYQLSRLMTKPAKWLCAHRRLRSDWASTQSDQSSLCAQLVAEDPVFLHANSEDSDQTGRMPRLTWVFAGRTVILLVLSWGGSVILCLIICLPFL